MKRTHTRLTVESRSARGPFGRVAFGILIGLGLGLLACDGGGAPEVTVVAESAVVFEDRWQRIDTVILDHPEEFPVINVRGVDVAPDGLIAITDGSEARIHLYRSDGSFVSTMGGVGYEATSLRSPSAGRFDQDGRVLVFDVMSRRIVRFDRSGGVSSGFSLAHFPRGIVDVLPLSDGEVLILSIRDEGLALELTCVDNDGNPLKTLGPFPVSLPQVFAEDPDLRLTFGMAFLAGDGDLWFAVHALTDTVWRGSGCLAQVDGVQVTSSQKRRLGDFPRASLDWVTSADEAIQAVARSGEQAVFPTRFGQSVIIPQITDSRWIDHGPADHVVVPWSGSQVERWLTAPLLVAALEDTLLAVENADLPTLTLSKWIAK